jgi:hypothetical protein
MPWEAILTIGAIAAALIALGTLVNRIYKIAKRIDEAVGVDDQGRTLSQRLSSVEEQLKMPDGRTITEKINAIEREQVVLQSQVGTMQRLLSAVLRRSGEATVVES